MHTDSSTPNPPRVRAWLWPSLLTIFFYGVWGLQSKIIVGRISPWMNQVLFPVGLLPLLVWILLSRRARGGINNLKGVIAALVTGILGGAGNVAFFVALARGGRVSIVVPMTCLNPLVTVILAYFFLHEKLTRLQVTGLVLALVAIYLLSV